MAAIAGDRAEDIEQARGCGRLSVTSAAQRIGPAATLRLGTTSLVRPMRRKIAASRRDDRVLLPARAHGGRLCAEELVDRADQPMGRPPPARFVLTGFPIPKQTPGRPRRAMRPERDALIA
ncbi:MAG TPA: hypothetical protein VE650_21665 [Acetobacteraceae bacterium]|nr:hypothetical protein [Acetobacteraceae bacterium]